MTILQVYLIMLEVSNNCVDLHSLRVDLHSLKMPYNVFYATEGSIVQPERKKNLIQAMEAKISAKW